MTRKLSILSAILIISILSGMAQTDVWDGTHTTWTHGNGTQNSPYLIESAEQLAHLACIVNSGTTATSDHIVAKNSYFKLTTDIDLNGSESFQWTPIGNFNFSSENGYFFGGYFDGNGHTIANLYINADTLMSVGLFGCVDNATVKNMGITTGIIKNSGNGGTNRQIVGVIVGYARTGCTIDNCYNKADSIMAFNEAIMVAAFAGGILGYGDVGADIAISNCYNKGNVASRSPILSFSGGIVGRVDGSLQVVNCYNRGNLSAASANSRAGGIVGCIWRGDGIEITNCYNTGSVSSTDMALQGGVAGDIYSSSNIQVTNSYYLDSCGGNNTYGGTGKTESEMQAADFVTMLNNGQNPPAWAADTQNDNSGYPILLWQPSNAIAPITSDNGITLYPNPVAGAQLTLTCEQWQTENRAEIYTILGVPAGSYKLTGKETAIPVSHLPAGTYFVKVGAKSIKIQRF